MLVVCEMCKRIGREPFTVPHGRIGHILMVEHLREEHDQRVTLNYDKVDED